MDVWPQVKKRKKIKEDAFGSRSNAKQEEMLEKGKEKKKSKAQHFISPNL